MENIIGHDKVKIILKKILDEDRVGHAYMFVGKEGIGKKLVAIEFAKQIMNQGESDFNEADFKIVIPSNNLIKIEEIRNIISEVYLKPAYSKHKVIIIDDADKMNNNAQNALLKVLEEPPNYVTIILIVANKEKIIKTILSRVTEVTFECLSSEELKQIVGDNSNIDYARGSASKALELIQGDYYNYSNELIEFINSKDFLSLNKKINEIKQLNIEIIKILEMLKTLYYKDLNNDTYTKVKIIKLLDNTINTINKNANTDLALDKLMIELCF